LYLLATLGSSSIHFITLPIFTRFLTPSDYGIIALFALFGQFSSGVLSLGLQSASYRYYFEYKNDNIQDFKILNTSIIIYLFIIFFIGGLTIYFAKNWISATLFSNEINSNLIFISFISGCFEYFITYFTALLTAQLRSSLYSIIIFMRSILRVVIAFYLIFAFSLTYMSLIYAIIITQGILVVVLFIVNKNILTIKFSISLFKKSLKFSYPNVLRLIIGLINSSFDKIMLVKITGVVAPVGYYSIAQKSAYTFKLFKDSIDRSWIPFFMEKAHENKSDSKDKIIERFFEISFIYMLGAFALITFSEELVKLLTTKDFYPAMYMIPLFVIYYSVGIVSSLTIQQIQFSEKTQYILPASILGIITNIILNIIFIPRFGVYGALFSLIISTIIANSSHLYFGFKLFPLNINKVKLLSSVFLIVIFSIPIYMIMYYDFHFIVKILFKFSIFYLFVKTCIKFDYSSKDKIKLFLKSKVV
jgi:O-antigen/teichoic acid export membrane protein